MTRGHERVEVVVKGVVLRKLERFSHLGIMVSYDEDMSREIENRISILERRRKVIFTTEKQTCP